jgi:hypothetical protein
MPDLPTIQRFLAQRHLAFVGVSRDPKQFANAVYRTLRDGGRTMYPVNRHATEVEGDECYATLAAVPDPLDGVVVMVPRDEVVGVVREAIARGAARVWLHRGLGQGAVPAEAIALCRAHGVDVVDGACPLMFEAPVRGVHRLHRMLAKRRFAA